MERRLDIDCLKGLAIMAVILYHVGILPYGYLGVDVFLTITGFLIIPKIIKSISNGKFSYFPWLFRHLYRVWPITLAATTLAMIIGFYIMFPDSYENLCQSVVASNLFANNILSSITSNYWDTVNEFKPLMQLWYLGVLVQFYVIFPLILLIICKGLKQITDRKWIIILIVISVFSLLLYILPTQSITHKFYLPQYRIWEFGLGGIIGLLRIDGFNRKCNLISLISLIGILIVFLYKIVPLNQIDNTTIIGQNIVSESVYMKICLTVMVVTLTGLVLTKKYNISNNCISFLGKISLSLFVWHQFILAFNRIINDAQMTIISFLIYLFVTIAISVISYYIIERIRLESLRSRVIFYSILFVSTVLAFLVYLNAGVVRDVPELGVSLENPYANRNTEYIDKIYQLDRSFSTQKIHVLVVGHSFARDFACILEEYDKDNQLEISYSYSRENIDTLRIHDSDYIFIFGSKSDVPDYIFKNINTKCRIFGIGTKSFGKYFGNFYIKRGTPNYFNQSISSNTVCDSINHQWEKDWGKENFVNMMDVIRKPDGSIPIFTPNNKVISFDCRHLTKDGCIYYANKIDFKNIFK